MGMRLTNRVACDLEFVVRNRVGKWRCIEAVDGPIKGECGVG